MIVASTVPLEVSDCKIPLATNVPEVLPAAITTEAGLIPTRSGRSTDTCTEAPLAGAGPSRVTLPCAARFVGSPVLIEVG